MSSLTFSSLASRIYGIASDVFNVPISQIGPESSPETIESWDSVHHLNLILALEQAFNLQLEPVEIDRMNSMNAVFAILSEKLNVQA